MTEGETLLLSDSLANFPEPICHDGGSGEEIVGWSEAADREITLIGDEGMSVGGVQGLGWMW